MAVFMANERFYVPDQAAMSIMRLVFDQLCAGCPISVGGEPPAIEIKLSYYNADIEITPATVFADINVVEADEVVLNQEASPTYCLDHLEGPDVDPETGLPTIFVDQHAITTVGDSQAFGAAIYADFGDGNVLLGVSKFPVAIGTGVAGDIFKIGGPWSLCACTPAAEE